MPYEVDFVNVSTVGVESSPHAAALAGLRANEARYFSTHYQHRFTVQTPSEAPDTLAYIEKVLQDERGIVFAAKPLQVSRFRLDGVAWAHVFYESGLAVNVLYTLETGGKRAVGFKLCLGMDVPAELAKFKFARQRSKLAGEIRGTFFVIKGTYA